MPDANATNLSGDVLKNVLLAREKFRDELHKLENEIEEAKEKSSYELAADVAKTGKLNRDQAVQKFNLWKAQNDRLATQKTALQHFLYIIEKEVSDADPESLVPILDELIASLRQTYSQEQGEADVLEKRIKELEQERAKKAKAGSKDK